MAEYYGVPVTVTSAYRTWEDQNRLYRNYRQCLATGNFKKTEDCKYPANKPGDSSHNYGLAWDSVVPDHYWPWWTALRRYLGFHVPDNDRVHAAVPNWRRYVL